MKIDVEGMEPEVLSGLSKTIATFRPIIAFEYSGHKHANWALIQEALSGYEFFEPVFRRGIAALFNGGMAELHPVAEGRSLVRKPYRGPTRRSTPGAASFSLISDDGGVGACSCGEIFGELRVPCAGGLRHRALSSHAFLDRAAAIITLVGPPLVPLSLGSLTITPNCLRDGELSTALWIKSTRDNDDCCPGLEQQVAHR